MEEQYRIILTKQQNKILFACLLEGNVVEFQLFSDVAEQIGTIYLGRVKQPVKNINASFVDFSENARGFLARADLKQGDLLPVQLIKAHTKTKDAVLSDQLSIAGGYSVVHTNDKKFSVSVKLPAPKRKQLRKDLKELADTVPFGVIVRTNAVHAGTEDLKKEILRSAEKLSDVLKYTSMRTPLSVLYKAPSEWMRAVADIKIDLLHEIITDDCAIYEELQQHLKELYGEQYFTAVNLKLYEDPMLPLKKLYSLEAKLSEALHKKVWLKSGGFLIIEPTEALVAIDVNTGKTTKKGSREETFLLTNKEAAKEISKQLRLRNLSGIILVDFINMSDPKNQRELMTFLAEEIKKDSVKTQLHGMTTLGLVEITRMKVRQPLYEQIKVADKA